MAVINEDAEKSGKCFEKKLSNDSTNAHKSISNSSLINVELEFKEEPVSIIPGQCFYSPSLADVGHGKFI